MIKIENMPSGYASYELNYIEKIELKNNRLKLIIKVNYADESQAFEKQPEKIYLIFKKFGKNWKIIMESFKSKKNTI